jgi:hypothetical protein
VSINIKIVRIVPCSQRLELEREQHASKAGARLKLQRGDDAPCNIQRAITMHIGLDAIFLSFHYAKFTACVDAA